MIVFFSAFLLSSALAAPQISGGDVFDAETECFEKHPSITREFVENLKQTKKLPENPTTEFKCFIACVGKILKAMTMDGDLHFDTLKNLTVAITDDASHDDAHGMVTKCIDADHDDHCEKAYQYVLCKIDELLPFTFSKDFCPTCTGGAE